MDSGTTSHMTSSKENMKIIKKIDYDVGVAKSNATMKAKGKGNIKFDQCQLNNVLYIPSLTSNLLSVNAITNNGGIVTFTKNEVFVKHKGQLVLERKKTARGLYEINLKKNINEMSHLTTETDKQIKNWHKKLGHPSIGTMKKLLEISEGMNFTNKDFDQLDKICETCQKAKQTRLPFKETRRRAQRPLEIIHTDLCGPIHPETWDGKKYFISFLDDYTHLVNIYLLKNKNEAEEVIKEYTEKVEAYWNMKIAKIRCDNGREYANSNVKN